MSTHNDVICQPGPGVQSFEPNSKAPGPSSASPPPQLLLPLLLLGTQMPCDLSSCLVCSFLPTLPGSASLPRKTIPDHPGWVYSPHVPLYRTLALYIDQFFYVCLPHLAVPYFYLSTPYSNSHRLSPDLTWNDVSHTHLLTCEEIRIGPGAVLRKTVGWALGAAPDNRTQQRLQGPLMPKD